MSAIVKVRMVHACKCIYRLYDILTIVGNVSETRKCMYSEMYLRYAREGLIVHLDMLIAKRKDLVVCVCLNCLLKVYRRISFVPDIPKEFEFVCLSYRKCFANLITFLTRCMTKMRRLTITQPSFSCISTDG